MSAIPSRGPFAFGPPYDTLGVRITNADDGEILPRTYSYWSNINAHTGRDVLRVFLGTSRGPCWWWVDKDTYQVTPMGAIFPEDHPLAASTAEGWYWDAHDPDVLYCSDDAHLYRYHWDTEALEPVADLTSEAWGAGLALRQWHTSALGIHSATVLQRVADGPWPKIGTAVYTEGAASPWQFLPKVGLGEMDEAQIDQGGRWLLVKENLDGLDGEDNRIISVPPGSERHLMDRDGAAGHSDNGDGYMVHADNWQDLATWRVTMFDPALAPQGRVVLQTAWDAQVIHVSHRNARPGAPDSQWVLGSGQLADLILVPLDGSQVVRPVAPSMCTYPTSDPYDFYPKATLDPAGEHALWTCFREGRFEAFLVRLAPMETPPSPPACTHGCPVHCCTHACPIHCPPGGE